MHRATHGKSLTTHQKMVNKRISHVRYRVERTFGSIRRWFHTSTARYVGLVKMPAQHCLEVMTYNLYRTPGIIMYRGLI